MNMLEGLNQRVGGQFEEELSPLLVQVLPLLLVERVHVYGD